MRHLREAANAGSEWDEKTCEAVPASPHGKAKEGEDWAREFLERLEAPA